LGRDKNTRGRRHQAIGEFGVHKCGFADFFKVSQLVASPRESTIYVFKLLQGFPPFLRWTVEKQCRKSLLPFQIFP
jgi:hypothetical protein